MLFVQLSWWIYVSLGSSYRFAVVNCGNRSAPCTSHLLRNKMTIYVSYQGYQVISTVFCFVILCNMHYNALRSLFQHFLMWSSTVKLFGWSVNHRLSNVSLDHRSMKNTHILNHCCVRTHTHILPVSRIALSVRDSIVSRSPVWVSLTRSKRNCTHRQSCISMLNIIMLRIHFH
jgi:hypothetical protein